MGYGTSASRQLANTRLEISERNFYILLLDYESCSMYSVPGEIIVTLICHIYSQYWAVIPMRVQ